MQLALKQAKALHSMSPESCHKQKSGEMPNSLRLDSKWYFNVVDIQNSLTSKWMCEARNLSPPPPICVTREMCTTNCLIVEEKAALHREGSLQKDPIHILKEKTLGSRGNLPPQSGTRSLLQLHPYSTLIPAHTGGW